MDIPLNVDVHCPDGRCGRSTHIIINPATEQVTHLVVKEQLCLRPETNPGLALHRSDHQNCGGRP